MAASDAYGLEAANVIAVGYSNGANIAASTLLLRPRVVSGAVLLRPMVPLEPEHTPDLSGVPVFIAAGRYDPIVPPANTQKLAALLQGAGAAVTLRWQAASHGLEREEIEDAQKWLPQVIESLHTAL